MDTLGQRIYNLRKRHNVTQTKIMNDLKFSNISKYEKDLREPSISVLISIAKYFNVSTDYLLCLDCKGNSTSEACEEQESYLINENYAQDLEILKLYRQLSDNDKMKIQGMIELKLFESSESVNNKVSE